MDDLFLIRNKPPFAKRGIQETPIGFWFLIQYSNYTARFIFKVRIKVKVGKSKPFFSSRAFLDDLRQVMKLGNSALLLDVV